MAQVRIYGERGRRRSETLEPPEPPPPVTPPPPAPGTPGGGENEDWTPPAQQTAPPPAPFSLGSYAPQLEGFDYGKLSNPQHETVKYQFARLASKYAPTPTGFSQLLQDPEFGKLGIQSIGNGNLRLPDGTIVDAVRGWNAGGYAWQWAPQTEAAGGTAGGAGGTGTTGTGGAGTTGYYGTQGNYGAYMPGMGQPALGNYGIPGLEDLPWTNEFTDPTTANFETLLQQRIDELNNPVSDAARQQYANLLQQYISGLSTADPSITDLIASLQQMATTLGQPGQGEQLAGSLATQYQGLDPEYAKAAQARIAQLQADPYTGAEWEAYRTNALDPIEADRTAAIQRALGNLADRGLNMDSGISQALVGEVNQGFDANRARAQNDLALSRVNQRMARSGEAFDVQTALANMLQGRQLTGLDIARQATADTTGRMGLQAQTYGTLADILPQRSQQQLGAAQSLSQLSGSVRGEEEARRQSAIALQGLLAEMPERRLQLALATLGQGTAPESVINSLMQVAGMANQSQALNNQASQQTWGGLGSLLGYLAPLWSQGSGSAGATGTGGVNWGGINPPKF